MLDDDGNGETAMEGGNKKVLFKRLKDFLDGGKRRKRGNRIEGVEDTKRDNFKKIGG